MQTELELKLSGIEALHLVRNWTLLPDNEQTSFWLSFLNC